MQALHERHPVDWYDYLEPDATEKWLEEIFSDPEELEILKSLAER